MQRSPENNPGNSSQKSGWDTLYREQAINNGMTAAERFQQEKRGKLIQDITVPDKWNDTQYRDEAIRDGLSVAMRFNDEKIKKENEIGVDPEEVEWYQKHLDKIGGLIVDGDIEKEQWYREHPEKIADLILEKNIREKSVDNSTEDVLSDTNEDVVVPDENNISQSNSDPSGENYNITSGDSETQVNDIPNDAPNDTSVSKEFDESSETVGDDSPVSDKYPNNYNFLEKVEANVRRVQDEKIDKQSVGTIEEQKAYEDWLKKHDDENLKNLQGREKHIIESTDNEFVLNRVILGGIRSSMAEIEKYITDYNLPPHLCNAIRRAFDARIDRAEEAVNKKKLDNAKESVETGSYGIEVDRHEVETNGHEVGTGAHETEVAGHEIGAAEREEIEAAEREEIEAAEREKIEAVEREKTEAAEREKIEAAEREKTEAAEEGYNEKPEKKRRNIKERLREIGKRLKEIMFGRDRAKKELDSINQEIKRIEEKRQKSASETTSEVNDETDMIEKSVEEDVKSDFDKARELYKKMRAVDDERAKMAVEIEELKGDDSDKARVKLEQLRKTAEEKREESVALGNEMSRYIHSTEEYDRIKSET